MAKEQQSPSIGRVVHYVLPGGNRPGKHRPAMVTDVAEDGTINLVVTVEPDDVVTNSMGCSIGTQICRDYSLTFFVEACAFDADGKPGTWHWPERA